ncbi:uncharacterized protein LOC118422245, partial [Branchiostoma floridae]|uniref:Uncharacterized protein LOC118422245 n=1 Tax=Branchiostoma floridae TaxID=7739 RepID=A0A9J7MZE0_BRAFL
MAKQWLNCVIVCAVFTLALSGLASSKFSSDRYCSKYHVLNEPWRSAQARSLDLYGRHHCDNKDGFQTTRWYRFMGEAGTTMPTKPPPSSHRCGSDAPVWMNGINPTYEDGVVERQVCARFDKKICRWRWNIRVKRCPEGFLIYKLKPVKACSLTYCGLGIQNMTVDDVTRPASNEDEDGSGALDNRKEDVHPACHHYITLDEPQRSVHYQVDPNTATNTLLCDKRSGLQHGSWYRFVGEGGVIMATERPLSTHRCGTHAPVWMRGPHPTIEEGVVTRTVCAFWDGNDCKWSWEIKVLSCPGDFFVYKLRKATQCILAYCTTDGAPQTTVPSPTPSMSVELLNDEDDETGSGEPHFEDVPATESPDNAKDVGAGSPHTPERRTSYLTHHKGWDYYKVPVIGKMTSANVKAACEAAGYVTPCSGDSDCMHSSSECVLTGLEDCYNPMNEVAQEMCGTRPYGCAKLQGVYQYMNTWSKGAACGVESKLWCTIGSKWEDRYAFCADWNATTATPQATTAAPQTTTTTAPATTTARDSRNCCGKILRQATEVVDQSSDYRVPDGWTMCYIDERDTAHHKTPCRDLLQGIPGYEDAEELLAAGGNFGCWHGTTGNSHGPAFATNNVIENSCKDGVQQETRLKSWNVRTTTLGVCIKGITCDEAPETTVPPPIPSIPDEVLSDDEDDVGSGEPDDKITRKNLALGKRTKQSSLWDAGYSQNAVDGDRSTNWYSGSCTHTEVTLRDNVWDIGTTDPWWYVELESSHPIGKVVIVNRRSPKHSVTSRINPFEIRIGNSKDVTANPKCGRRHVFPGDEDVMEVSCGGIQGRYVGIRLPGENRILTLCEVEVYADENALPTTVPFPSDDEDDVGSGDSVDDGPCTKHYKFDDAWRDVSNGRDNKCDRSGDLKHGEWHRFSGSRGSMMIPTERPLTTNRCGTHAPVWMKGKLPTVEEGVVTRAACAFWGEDECNWSWDIDVMACPGGYFVYKLPKPPVCHLAYCTTYDTPQPSPTMIPAISDGSLSDDEDEVGSGEPDDKDVNPQTTMPSTTTIPTPTEDPSSDANEDDADSRRVEGSV